MKKEEILTEIASEFLELNAKEIELDRNRDEYDQWDSLVHVQIAAEISDRFAISIPFEELAEIKVLRDFVKYIGV